MSTLEVSLISAAAKEVFAPARELLTRVGRSGYDQLLVSLGRAFGDHVTAARTRCSYIKNLIYRDQATDIMGQYVNVQFSRGAANVTDKSIIDSATSECRYVISGTAGAGKTMFMKWITLQLINNIGNHGRIPVFLELRYLEEDEANIPLCEYLLQKTASARGKATYSQFRMGLEAGLFIVILDAADEVHPAFRGKMLNKFRDFLREYPKCAVIISTRPDDAVESIQELTVVRTLPMVQRQIVSVIDNLQYDLVVKNKLLHELKNGLFERHESFLSNPLLATIMLLTYDHAADVPSKITSFYKQAFEALYQRHDAAKGAYRRGHHAKLTLDEYSKVFSVFCYQSYVSAKYEFSDADLLVYFREAAEYQGVSTNPELIVKDATESVSLIQKEGLDNVFVHRSFQEYFAALFVSEYRGPEVSVLIEALGGSIYRGNALRMLFEINRDLVESEWIIPKLDAWLVATRRLKLETKSGLCRMFDLTFSEMEVNTRTGNVEALPVEADPFAGWMSDIGGNYERDIVSEIFFNDEPVVGTVGFEKLIEQPAAAKLPSLARALEHRNAWMPVHEFDDGQSGAVNYCMAVSPKDAEWLIFTPLPARFAAFRREVQLFRDALADRLAKRRSSAKRMALTAVGDR